MELLESGKGNLHSCRHPYAVLASYDEDPAEAFLANKRSTGKAGELGLTFKSEVSAKLESKQASERNVESGGNPYAILASLDEDPVDTFLAKKRAAEKMSKKDFELGCRRIFLQYIPPDEGRVLRPHYRNFITRNENSSPEWRSRLLDELGKYDISTSGNFQPHFNRENELLTAKKLLQIEIAAKKS